MRTVKRILVIFMIILVSQINLPAVFGAGELTTEEKAQILYDLDLFKGTNTNYFEPSLENEMDRAQGIVMIGRALGWDLSEDWNKNAVSDFDDVPNWAEPYVAYAVDQEITYGIGGGLFGSDMLVTERQLKTWFDRALGEGDTWDDNIVYDNSISLIRADLVEETWDTLKKAPVGQEQTLIETIVGEDDAKLSIALNANLIESDLFDIKIETAGNFTTAEGSQGPGSFYEAVTVTFNILGSDLDRIESISIMLYNANGDLMATNVHNGSVDIATALTTLFVINTNGYNDEMWTTDWEIGYPTVDTMPGKAVIEIIDNFGNIYSAEDNDFNETFPIFTKLDIQVSSVNNFTSISSSLKPGNYYEGVIASFNVSGTDKGRIVSVSAELKDEYGNLMVISSLFEEGNIDTIFAALFIVNSNESDYLQFTSWNEGHPDISSPPASATLVIFDDRGMMYTAVEEDFNDGTLGVTWDSFFDNE